MNNQEQKEVARVRQFGIAFTIVFVACIVGMTYYVTKQRVEQTAKVKQEDPAIQVIPASVNK